MWAWCGWAREHDDDRARESLQVLHASRTDITKRVEYIVQQRKGVVTSLDALRRAERNVPRLRYLLTTVRDFDRRIANQYGLLTSVEASIGRLEDALSLRPTLSALKSGNKSMQIADVETVEKIVATACERQDDIEDAYRALADGSLGTDDEIDNMPDDALEAYIDRLLATTPAPVPPRELVPA